MLPSEVLSIWVSNLNWIYFEQNQDHADFKQFPHT